MPGICKIDSISHLSKTELRFNSESPASEKMMETTGFLAVPPSLDFELKNQSYIGHKK